MVCAGLRKVCARFAQGFRKVYAEGAMFSHGLRKVCARFAQGFRRFAQSQVFAGLRKVFARFTQGFRKVFAGFRGADLVCATRSSAKTSRRFTQVFAWFTQVYAMVRKPKKGLRKVFAGFRWFTQFSRRATC